MADLNNGVAAAVLGAYWTIQFLYFARRVSRYSETHSTEDTVAFADAIRPTAVAALGKVADAVTARARDRVARSPDPSVTPARSSSDGRG
ncbi:MAG TPA: hypothetical protein VFQ85_13720 [Mycobacteriales bacterium]|jgi:hypothetical protein|nr:hypothetical protein [Mycobacteriales bacterium]